MSGEGFFGQQGLPDATSDLNLMYFIARQVLGQTRTAMPVKIIAVHGGGVDRPPTVDVQPMIKQVDGQGNATEHGVIFGIATTRSQGGAGGIINDPRVGDTGIMSIADRDISSFKANNGEQSTPGSKRTFDPSDGIYHGSMLQTAPVHYIHFVDDGINISTPGTVTINGVTIDATGKITSPVDIIASGHVSLTHHKHSGVTPGGGQTGEPV